MGTASSRARISAQRFALEVQVAVVEAAREGVLRLDRVPGRLEPQDRELGFSGRGHDLAVCGCDRRVEFLTKSFLRPLSGRIWCSFFSSVIARFCDASPAAAA